MLYIKIDPFDRVTHYNTSSQKIGVSGPLKKFEGLLTYYISKLILVIGGPWNVNLSSLKDCWHVIYQNWFPVIGKLIATHRIRRLVGQGPTRHLKKGHRAQVDSWNVNFSSLEDWWHLYFKIYPISRETHWKTAYHKTGMSGAPQAPKKHCWHFIYLNWSHMSESCIWVNQLKLCL